DMESLEIAHIPDKPPLPLPQQPTVSVYAAVINPKHAHTLVRKLNEFLPLESLRHAKRDSSGMLSLLSTLEQSLKSGKKHALHATSVTNVCMGLLYGLKSILAEGGIYESQRRASSDGLGLLARLGNDMFTVWQCADFLSSMLCSAYGYIAIAIDLSLM
ncbi:hypothetical protein Tco_1094782, partial [Tanacetum coccineum]